jgi:putative NADH-flavin reductase
MKILIFGASGKTGQELVKQALEQGHQVTAFVRTPSKLIISNDNLRVFQGDVTNYALVEKAVQGHDAVYSTLGAASPFKFDQSVVDGLGHIVRAMEQQKVNRLIYMSAINVKESRKHAGLLVKIFATTLLRTETAGHEEREKIIRQSQLEWTMVRPATLNNGAHKAVYRSGEMVKAKGIAVGISRADAADFLLRQLTDNTFLKKAPMVMY